MVTASRLHPSKLLKINIFVGDFGIVGYCYGCLVLILLNLEDIRWSGVVERKQVPRSKPKVREW